MHSPQLIQRIAIIGFGEVGGLFGHDLAKQATEVSVYDILLDSRKHRQPMLAKARACGVTAKDSLRACVQGADLVISAVTASSALDVAKEAAPILGRGQIYLDINSVSPKTKRKAAAYIERTTAGPSAPKSDAAHYIEAAVMEAVPRNRLKVPMLLGGAHAADAAERLRSIGMHATVLSDQIGVASAVKMCRSVMIKGLEALTVECLFAARRYGAEHTVLETLVATYPAMGWGDHLPDYLISRVAQHGRRRAVEMREAAAALRDVGIDPLMALATAQRQEKLVGDMAERDLSFDNASSFSWRALADEMLTRTQHRSARRKRNRT